jgi:hypothetical protein
MRLRKYAGPLVGFTAVAAMVHVAGCAGQSSSGFPSGDDGGSSSGSSGGGFSTSSGSGSSTSSSGTSTSSSGTSSSGGFGSTSGSGSGSSSGSSSSGSSTSSSGGGLATCTPTSTGGLALVQSYLTTAAGNPGTGGYAFAYQDALGGDVCLDGCPSSGASCATSAPPTSMLCLHGTIAASGYGGIGFGLSQSMSAPSPGPFPATGSGIKYAVTSVPTTTGLRVAIDHGGAANQYCAVVTAPSGTVTWADLLLNCYDTPPGAALTGPPTDATQIQFQLVNAGTADFCVTAVSFAP